MSMPDPAERTYMTADELLELGDDRGKLELVRGMLIRMPLAGYRHGRVAARIASILDKYVEARDLGSVCGADTGFILAQDPDTVRGPDAAFVTKAHGAMIPNPEKFCPFAPDLAVEVVSPSDRVSEVHEKIREYFAAGTRLVWVVYPDGRIIDVYRSPSDVRTLGVADYLDGDDVIPGFSCPVRRCFD